MRKYQLKFVTVYIRQMAHRFRLENIRPQGIAWAEVSAGFSPRIRDRSASLTAGCSAGVLRNQTANAKHHNAATPENVQLPAANPARRSW